MSTSTLPKSIQAQVAGNETGIGTTSSQDQAESCREFVERMRNLPDDFLRIPSSYYPPQSGNLHMSQQASATIARDSPLSDVIAISVIEAQLVKNYGLLRMDLYCKIRVGHMSLETETCLNGGKNPKWRDLYHFNLQPGIDSFHLEIYNQKSFSLDEKIAWMHEQIPTEIFQGITVERWFPLSGRLGQDKEGSVLVVLSHKRVPISSFGRPYGPRHQQEAPLTVYVPAANQTPMIVPGAAMEAHHVPAYIQPPPPSSTTPNQPHPQSQPVDIPSSGPVSEEDINQLSEMFPSLDKAIIKAVLENNHNDKETAIGALLALA